MGFEEMQKYEFENFVYVHVMSSVLREVIFLERYYLIHRGNIFTR